MRNKEFSFVILTFNEEIHLPRLLNSIKDLDAPIFILDSGSTDGTLDIAKQFNANILSNPFENHPKQWDFALKSFQFESEWIIGLDADQIVTPELFSKLKSFRSADIPENVNGIYFNRKNYFKGTWVRYGGYFPKYMLKMFRRKFGYSDLNENMDHRFIAEGKTIIWKTGYLIEENLKENDISFWIVKHNRYSDFLAKEEVERLNNIRKQTVKGHLFGSPDQRIAYIKNIWWRLPLYVRPFLYFIYRFFWKWGFLDSKQGRIFHFLHAFWFRLLVDIKIEQMIKNQSKE
jgi:glycosyltransferase involved in cell wall biosynthesis